MLAIQQHVLVFAGTREQNPFNCQSSKVKTRYTYLSSS